MSFLRHGEIYRPMQKRGRPAHDRPQPHRYDEFPAGYSLAGCAPAEPASPSPAITHSAGNALGSTIKMQRTAKHLLTACLTQGDNPNVDFQLFFYLADPEAVVVSYEKFSGEIVRSPQRSRIITFDQFRRL